MTRMFRVWNTYGKRTYVGLVVAAALSGCGNDMTGNRAAGNARQGVTFVPDAQGLAISGRSERIDFGRSPRGVIPILDREVGNRQELGVTGCPAGVVRQVAWGDLVLTFGRERFVGWKKGPEQSGSVCA